MTPSQAQKTARRRALATVGRLYGVTPTGAALQRATATVQRTTGRARGGRVPDRLKLEGFRRKEKRGAVTYTYGSERGRALPDAHARAERMVVAAFAAHPGARVAVALHGKPARNESPKRHKRDHPLGMWKKGDVIAGARHWGQTAQVSSPEAWERAYGIPENLGEDTDTQLENVNAIHVVVRLGQ